MFKKPLTIILVILMFSPIITMTHETSITSTHDTPLQSTAVLADMDPARVVWEENLVPNSGLEEWSNPHNPTGFSTSRTEEKDGWYETTIVSEGATSFGMLARAVDVNHHSEAYLCRSTQMYWDNPTNLTLDVDWYLDSIGNPVDQDYFRVEINLNYHVMYYYFGCETTTYTNSSSRGYFMIDGATQTWNHLHRNLTSDYTAVFGGLPTQYRTMYWRMRSYTNDYTRAFIDDIHLVNGTTKIGGSEENGDFEGGGGWSTVTGEGAGDIAQCSESHEGLWSMNMTAFTNLDNAYAYANYRPEKLLTADNKNNLSFWWNLSEYIDPGLATYARVAVDVKNATFYSTIYYYLFVGGSGMMPLIITGNNLKFAVDGFNVTDTWNFFDRNILNDFTSIYTTENLWVEEIEFQVKTYDDNALLSLLVDDITFTTSIVNDLDYEHQDAVGEPIQGWDNPESTNDRFTVTDFSLSGTKAANLTLTDDESYSEYQSVDLPINGSTEVILDFNVYIDTFNTSSEDFVYISLEFSDETFVYVIANSTSEFEDEIGEGDGNFILLQDTLVTGKWLNFQLDIVHDYELLFGSLPDGTLYDISLYAAAGPSSKLSVIFDDLYIYYDTSPEIVSVDQTPTVVVEAGKVVEIAVEVIDASGLTITITYRVDAGDWTNLTQEETGNGNYTIAFNAPWGETEYFIIVEDAFGKSDVAMDGGGYFTFTTTDTTSPVITLTPENGSTVSDIVSIEMSVEDSGSGVAFMELYIEGNLIANVTLDYVGVSWNTTGISDGEYNITVVAVDNTGNTASVTHLVTVDNTTTTTTTTDDTTTDDTTTTTTPPPESITGILLLVVIIAIAGIVLVLYIFVIKKK
ncbi:MAG: Ig-like domain-containing protein [Candidatus Thorarchaeota archaeon]